MQILAKNPGPESDAIKADIEGEFARALRKRNGKTEHTPLAAA